MPSSSSSSTPRPFILVLILVFLCATALSLNDNEGEVTCTDDFVKLKDRHNITMCKSLRTLGAEFAWKYQNDTNGSFFSLDVLFGAGLDYIPGWMAWGVNPGKRPEMIGTNAIVGIIPSDDVSQMKVRTYAITKLTRKGCPLEESHDLEGVRVVNTTIAYDEGSQMYTVYARLILNSSVYNETKLNHVWQIGYALNNDNNPAFHPTTLNNVDSTETIDLTSGQGRSVGQNRGFLRKVHGALNIVGWGTLLPIGVIVARYFRVHPVRTKRTWYYLHVTCQSVGYLIGTSGWAIGLWLGHTSRYYIFQTHRIFAIFIFTFTTIQMLALRLKPSEKDEYRKYWNMYHHFLGYSLLVIIFMNIFKGISILQGGEGWKWAYVGILAFLGAITLSLEIFTWGKFFYDKHKRKKEPVKQEDQKSKSGTGGS